MPLDPQSIADELRRFNQWRMETFGRAPTPDKPLPLPPTNAGGDVPVPETQHAA